MVEIGVGDLLTVRLNENPTTGYRWEPVTTRGLELMSDHFESTVDSIGASGIRVFQFRAAILGQHELLLNNLRSWEGNSSIINHFNAIIFVK